MKRFVNPPVQEIHVFPRKMSTFVKPTRKQEKNTSKTHENIWKNDEKT